MVEDQNLGYALGASEYLTKPIDRERLLAVVRRYTQEGANEPILVVDDDDQTRHLLRRSVEKAGFPVLEARDGREALEHIDDVVPQLILLDLIMPRMNGFEFLAALREREFPRPVPIVVITAKDLSPEERQILEGATERVLQKGSYTREELLAEVHALVEERTSGE